MDIQIKAPETEAEFKAMWELNHNVFASELHQHAESGNGALLDKFHDKNIYRIAWDGEKVLGMISAHWREPFSAVKKFGDVIGRHIISGKTAEIRLFAVRPECRNAAFVSGKVAGNLLDFLKGRGFVNVIISGISAQRRYYEHIGFRCLGEPRKEGDSVFYPMVADLDEVLKICRKAIDRSRNETA